MCVAPEGGVALEDVDVSKEAVIQGVVTRGDQPVQSAYVRLLDRTGEFTAEVQTSDAGGFRFFAAPGRWTLRTLAPKAAVVDRAVVAERGSIAEVTIAV
jgi:aminoglycoside phosphotransferase (APT) family kinase protein